MNTQKIVRTIDLGKPIFRGGLLPARHDRLLAVSAVIVAAGACLLAARSVQAAEPSAPQEWAAKNIDDLVELYRHLHTHPELSLQEEKTSARMADELRAVGAKVTAGVGGYGVVGILENGPGKVVMLRADMDALPVAEETGLPYASQVTAKDARGATVPVMHACGHDIHMTNMIGVARFLATHRDQWQGTVIFLLQPAEELGGGAKLMLDAGLFDRFPRPDYAVALHVASDLATGKCSYLPGYAMANVDSIDILIKGRGGHGSAPDTTIDPIVIAARLIMDLQTIVSREIKPSQPAVVTVGSIHAGTKHNIIPDDCRLQITVRSYSAEVREKLQKAIRRKALAAAASAGAAEPIIEISEGTPSVYNDPPLTARVAESLKGALGDANVVNDEPSMGGEDFSRYGLAGVPICLFRLGAVSQQRLDEFEAKDVPPPSLHSAVFYPDAAETLTTGVPAMVAVALDLLAPAEKPVGARE